MRAIRRLFAAVFVVYVFYTQSINKIAVPFEGEKKPRKNK